MDPLISSKKYEIVSFYPMQKEGMGQSPINRVQVKFKTPQSEWVPPDDIEVEGTLEDVLRIVKFLSENIDEKTFYEIFQGRVIFQLLGEDVVVKTHELGLVHLGKAPPIGGTRVEEFRGGINDQSTLDKVDALKAIFERTMLASSNKELIDHTLSDWTRLNTDPLLSSSQRVQQKAESIHDFVEALTVGHLGEDDMNIMGIQQVQEVIAFHKSKYPDDLKALLASYRRYFPEISKELLALERSEQINSLFRPGI